MLAGEMATGSAFDVRNHREVGPTPAGGERRVERRIARRGRGGRGGGPLGDLVDRPQTRIDHGADRLEPAALLGGDQRGGQP